jgi:uncharacterized protein YuzE
MRAEYDSRADALQVFLSDAAEWRDSDEVAGAQVDFDADGVPAGIELLSPAERLESLVAVAERFSLDGEALVAVARAALAAPDRPVTVSVGERTPA